MKPKPLPSQDELLALLRYEPETGKLFWLERPRSRFSSDRIWRSWNGRFAGKEALTATTEAGYKLGAINSQLFYAHRVIIKMVLGIDVDEVDHESGDRDDNRWGKILPADHFTNSRNVALRSNNTSGTVGVSWARRDRRWVASISDGKRINLGCFLQKEDAISTRKAAEVEYGYHANHGRAA